MGKGDKKSKRGKIWRGTYGKKRRKKRILSQPVAPPAEKEKNKDNN